MNRKEIKEARQMGRLAGYEFKRLWKVTCQDGHSYYGIEFKTGDITKVFYNIDSLQERISQRLYDEQI